MTSNTYQGQLVNGFAPVPGYSNSMPGTTTNSNGNPINTSTSNGVIYDSNGNIQQNDYSNWVTQTRYDGNGGAYTVRVPNGTPLPVSSTTLSNVNKMNQVPQIQQTTNSLSANGITTDANGVAKYADGSLVPQPQVSQPTDPNTPPQTKTTTGGYNGDFYVPPGSDVPLDANGNPVQLTDYSPTDQRIIDSINQMKAQGDAATAALMDSIHQKYAALISQQQQTNAAQQKIVDTSLLMGGATGQGSASQYAPISSAGISAAQTSYGIQQIANLQAQENSAIIAAQQAGQNQDFKLQDELNQKIASIRDEKVAAANKLNDKLLEQKQKADEAMRQASRDNAIADLYSQGVTDPKQLLDYLNYDDKGKQIGDFTSKEITDTLKNISNTDDINKVLTEAAKNGATQDVLAKIGRSKDLTEALTNAGQFMSSPSTEILKLGDNQAYLIDKNTGKIIKSFGGGGIGGTGNGISTASPYAGVINTILASGKFTKDQATAIRQGINNGEDPFTVVKNNAKNIMGQTEATNLTKFETAKSAVSDLQTALKDYYAKGGKTNIFSGKYEKVINNLGRVNNPDLVDLATQIQASLQIYRNAVSGTAYSAQEGADIASIFPGINKTQGLNDAILKGRLKAFDSTIDSTYRTALGSAYDKLKAAENSTVVSKGNMTDRDFVAKAFEKTNQKYDQVINNVPEGQIPVVDNESGQIGYIPYTEFTSNKYTKL